MAEQLSTISECQCGRSNAAHAFEYNLAEVTNDLLMAWVEDGRTAAAMIIERVIECFIGVAVLHPEWILGAWHALELNIIEDDAISTNAQLIVDSLPIRREDADE